MKKLGLIILIALFITFQFSIVSNAYSYYGCDYTNKDVKKATEIYKKVSKSGKSITVKYKKEKKVDAVSSAYLEKYFCFVNGFNSVCEFAEGDGYYECKFKGGKVFKNAVKLNNKREKEYKKRLKKIRQYEENILKQIGDYDTEYEWFIAMENYLINNTSYEEHKEKDVIDEFVEEKSCIVGNVYNFVRYGSGICADYSVLVSDLCKLKGIQVCIVSGGSIPEVDNHAWNKVVLDRVPYYVDVTWDVCNKCILYGPKCNVDMFNGTHYFTSETLCN